MIKRLIERSRMRKRGTNLKILTTKWDYSKQTESWITNIKSKRWITKRRELEDNLKGAIEN